MIALLLLLAGSPLRDGTLTLDADAPFVTVTVDGIPLRLRVDLDQREMVELNPAAAARLGLAFEDGFAAQVGRVELPGRQVAARAVVDGRALRLGFATHRRDCCAGVDGAVSPSVLPYATVRFVRAGAITGRRRFALIDDEDRGLSIVQGPVSVQLSLAGTSMASKAAGVRLAEGHGGRFAGPYRQMAGPFGVMRPVRTVAFASPPVLLGFALRQVPVRVADYGGRLVMPEERPRPADIVVKGRTGAQAAWPVVVLGREYLDGCAEIIFHAAPLAVDLACDFAGGPRVGGAAALGRGPG